MLESTRKKEEDVKRETTAQLDLFRKQQEEADKALLEEGEEADDSRAQGKADSPEASETQWAVNAKKRKRAREKEGLKGVKLRKSSTNEPPHMSQEDRLEQAEVTSSVDREGPQDTTKAPPTSTNTNIAPAITKSQSPRPASATGLGLAGYSSDEED